MRSPRSVRVDPQGWVSGCCLIGSLLWPLLSALLTVWLVALPPPDEAVASWDYDCIAPLGCSLLSGKTLPC